MGLKILMVIMCVIAFGGAVFAWKADNGGAGSKKNSDDSEVKEK